MKKLIPVLVLLFAFTVVFASCGGGTTEEQTSSTQSGGGSQTEAVTKEQPGEISFKAMVPQFGIEPEGTPIQAEWLKKMEAYMGMKLNITWERIPWADYTEKTKVILASGDIPDVFTYSDYNSLIQYGGQGLVLDISQYFDIAPNYMSFVEGTPDYEGQIYTSDKKSYGFQDGFMNTDNIEGAQSLSVAAYRFDIFKKHNIKIPETIDEFYDAAKKLKELYPDTYPISNSAKAYTLQRSVSHIFHTNSGEEASGVYYNGKEFAYGPVEDSYKEALMWLNKLYEEKLIDPAFLTDTDDMCTEKAVTGKVFMMPTIWAGMANHYNRNGENIEWGLAMLPENPKYGTPWTLLSQLPGKTVQQRFGIGLSAKTEYPELMVKLVDYQYSEEMIELVNWGIKGTTYEVGADGQKQFLPAIAQDADPARKLGEVGASSSMVCRSGIVFTPQDFRANIATLKQEPWYHNGEFMQHQYWLATSEFGGKEAINPNDRAPQIQLSTDEQTLKANILNAAKTYALESAAKLITGEMSFDKWEEYKATMKKMGDYQQIVDMYNNKLKEKGK